MKQDKLKKKYFFPHKLSLEKNLVPPGLEPGTFRVLSERDNHYTTGLWVLESKFKGAHLPIRIIN